jgi:hypothetical protein
MLSDKDNHCNPRSLAYLLAGNYRREAQNRYLPNLRQIVAPPAPSRMTPPPLPQNAHFPQGIAGLDSELRRIESKT